MGGGARSRRDGRQRQWSSGRDGAARAATVAGRDSGRRMRTRQRSDGKGGGSDRNPKLWCHVTHIGYRRERAIKESQSTAIGLVDI